MKTLLNIITCAAVFLVTNPFVIAQSADATAIKAVIRRETQAYFTADANAWRNCWANVSEAHTLNYSAMSGRVSQGVMPGDIPKAMTDRKPVGMKIETTKEQMRINGTAAFVQYNQHLTRDDGAEDFSYQARYLEKMNGVWKIIHVSSLSTKYLPPKNKPKP
jgi:hypothetical protein